MNQTLSISLPVAIAVLAAVALIIGGLLWLWLSSSKLAKALKGRLLTKPGMELAQRLKPGDVIAINKRRGRDGSGYRMTEFQYLTTLKNRSGLHDAMVCHSGHPNGSHFTVLVSDLLWLDEAAS